MIMTPEQFAMLMGNLHLLTALIILDIIVLPFQWWLRSQNKKLLKLNTQLDARTSLLLDKSIELQVKSRIFESKKK